MRVMRLTADLVARCHREVPETKGDPAHDYFEDADYDRATTALLAARPAGPLWLFAYGSLLWRPEFDATEARRAVAYGWQRGFSMQILSHRGTPEQPGYMMCLDPGGECEGLALRLREEDVAAQIRTLLYREIGSHEALDGVRWIEVKSSTGPLKALTFYARPDRLPRYQPNRPLDEIAYGLARACGHWGSGAAYLYNTVSHLEDLGIHDPRLWELQERVAAEIERIETGQAAGDAGR